ncbi:MAG: methylmalonyl Co-A mutase-associated GTPase MeaB, partial [Anaerolineae bacterium]|nr:methylmalonyl Co-A mutase-associated GTPase MeaB [Anaerolineae bacterium]
MPADDTRRKPEWTPPDAGDEFAGRVMRGVEGGHDGLPSTPVSSATSTHPRPRRRQLTVDDYVQGVLEQDRTILARAITLVESNAPAHL